MPNLRDWNGYLGRSQFIGVIFLSTYVKINEEARFEFLPSLSLLSAILNPNI